MSSNSMDEDELIASLLLDENNEDYMETCDDEVNDMVPRLERLCINDNELTDLPSGLSIDTVPSSIKNFEGASIADSNDAVSPIFLGDKIWVSDVTKAADGSKKSLSKIDETSQDFSTNTQVDIQSQDVIEKDPESGEIHMHPIDAKEEQILDKTKEMKETGAESVCDESPLDLSPKRNMDHNDEAKSISAVSENKTELKSLMIVPEKMKHVDPETGEITENSSIILPDTPGSNSIGKALVLSADVMDSGIVFDPHSPKLSYSADESSDDESHGSSGIMLDSPPDICAVNTASVQDKRYRKITVIVPPVSGMSENIQRRFCVFQPPFSIIDASKTNSSDEESKNSGAIRKDSPINSRRKSRKTVKSSPRLKALNHSDVKNE
ncbi:hypothetical protein AVEN_202177-1, partial [Araneus ventricosus]